MTSGKLDQASWLVKSLYGTDDRLIGCNRRFNVRPVRCFRDPNDQGTNDWNLTGIPSLITNQEVRGFCKLRFRIIGTGV